MNDQFDYIAKVIIIGDSNSGKSCLLHYFLENKFKTQQAHTIGVEFGSKLIDLDTGVIKLQIWDTAGQERYKAVTRSYYRGALGALVLYDVTNRESFLHLQDWVNDARTLARPELIILVVGNKIDLSKRQVSFEEASV